MPYKRMMQKRLKHFEVSERKQVGDAESMISQESRRLTPAADAGAEL